MPKTAKKTKTTRKLPEESSQAPKFSFSRQISPQFQGNSKNLFSKHPLVQIRASKLGERQQPEKTCKLCIPDRGWESSPITYEAANAIYNLIRERRLSDSIQHFENLGFSAEDALFLIALVQQSKNTLS
jgi:hypothetical protein